MAKQSKTTITNRIIWVLLCLFFAAMIAGQIYIYLNKNIHTEVALLYDTTESIGFKGIFARDERAIRVEHTEITAYAHKDGTKLAKNSVVAKSYNNRRDILLQSKIEEIEGQIEILKNAEILKNTDNSQIESLSNQITNSHSALMKQVNSGDYDNVSSHKSKYLSLQCKKEIVRGTYSNYDEKIAELNSEMARLSAQMSSTAKNIIVSDSGYFVSNVDGYESIINTSNISDFTKDELLEIIKAPIISVSDEIIGKMVDDYKWQLAGLFDTEQTRGVYEGLTVPVRIGSGSKVISVNVIKVKRLDDGSSIIIFECDKLTDEFLKSRTTQFRLLLDNHNGIRIPRSAVRFNEQGENGVFIKNGIELHFAKINVLLNEEEYLIVENTTSKPGYLSLYDIVVVEGKDLYEGKIVYD